MTAASAGRRFAGTSILVVGAATGIGEATAHRFATEGARVGVADLDADAAVARFGMLTGTIDALVHVAGGDVAHGDFERTDDDTWRAMLDLNLLGPVRVARQTLRWLRRSTKAPSIVIVGSINATLTLGSEPYSAAKAGLAPLVANLAAELGPDGIRVNAVAPGTIRTRVWDEQGGPDRLAALYPLCRVGEPADVAAGIAFLCSADASWITGHTLPIDGGLSVRKIRLDG